MLEGFDEALVEQLKREDTEFRRLLDEHQKYETQLVAYADLRFLTNEQEIERKRLQKLKLQGKDRLVAILQHYQSA
jgi:hypothetical protein